MSSSSSPILEVLAQRNYGRYAAGNAVSLIGTWMQRVAVGWLTWELTHSGAWLGAMAVADLAPTVIMGPLGGVVADRLSPVRITLVCQVAAMLLCALLAALTYAALITAPLLAALVFAQGLVMGFAQPARLTLVYALVPRAHLVSAVALNSVVFNGARFVGPALAGAALVLSGPALAFAINAISFVAFIVALASLDVTYTRSGGGSTREDSFLHELVDGARYAFNHGFIGPLLVFLGLFAVTVRAHVELLPGFADRVLGGGAAELAMLSSATGVGAVVAGVWLANRGGELASARFVAVCAGAAALATLGLAASTHLLMAIACVTLTGAAVVMAGITAQTLLQLNVEAEFRARVLSLYGLMFRSGPALGALLMGVAADWWGLQWPIAVGAVAALLVALDFWRRAAQVERSRTDR